MGVSLPGRGGGRFGPSLSDINVTPLVDVVLVLLIIFMVTAPMMTRGIDVRLPKTESGTDATEQRLVVTVDTDNTVYLNERPVVSLSDVELEIIAAARRGIREIEVGLGWQGPQHFVVKIEGLEVDGIDAGAACIAASEATKELIGK